MRSFGLCMVWMSSGQISEGMNLVQLIAGAPDTMPL